MKNEELVYQLSLQSIKGVGFGTWSKLINSFGSAKKLYEDPSVLITSNQNKNLQLIGQEILDKKYLEENEKKIIEHINVGIQIISYYDEKYPQKLKEISSPPCFLFVKGNCNLNCCRSISVVGSRTPSDYGKEMVNKIVKELSQYSTTIVSGLAYGIDFLAHDQSIKSNIPTIAVLSGGLDRIYPVVHKPLAESIIKHNGAIISEFPLGIAPESFNFPARNRIIAGFSDATVVIEAGLKSGSNITAICANDYDREVFAVPGNIGNELSVGCNNLIKKNQAHLITCADDIAEIMNWDINQNVQPQNVFNNIPNDLDDDSKKIMEALQKQNALSIDELSKKVAIPIDKLSMILLQLELLNLIKILPGNRYSFI